MLSLTFNAKQTTYATPGVGTPALVAEGDSRTVANGATSWVTQLSLSTTYTVTNMSTTGSRVALMIGEALTQVDPSFVYGVPKNTAIIWGGVNDAPNGDSVNTIWTNLLTWAMWRRARGFSSGIMTELPATDGVRAAISWNTAYMAPLNTLIRANAATYGYTLIDIQADSRLQDASNATYFQDQLHPTTAGQAVIAGIASAAINAL